MQKLEFDAFIAKIIKCYKSEVIGLKKKSNKQNYSIPIFVGAGISASANVPLNIKLQKKLNDELSNIIDSSKTKIDTSTECSYTQIYNKIELWLRESYVGYEKSTQYSNSLLKNKLRNLMHAIGIPREKDECLPNRSNIILIRLLLANFFGPIISLNIDSLLLKSLKTYYLESFHRVKLISNISQFSDHLEEQNENCVIFQPHGTIEEPLSLRFTQDELMDKEDTINKAISLSLDNSQNIICIGLSFSDDTINQILVEWAKRHEKRFLNLFISEFGKEVSSGVKKLVKKFKKDNVSIYVVTNCNSDDLLLSLSKKLRKETKKSRGSGLSDIHIHPDIQTVLLNQLCLRHNGKGESLIRIVAYNKIMLSLINSTEPVLEEFLIKQLFLGNEVSSLSKSDYFKIIQSVIVDLKSHMLIREVTYNNKIFLEINEENSPTNTDSSNSKRFIVEDFLTNKGVSKEDYHELVREDYRKYDPSKAIGYFTKFTEPTVIETHKDMDMYLDSLKEDLANKVQYSSNNSFFICGIITENGRHLFKQIDLPRKWLSDIISTDKNNLKMEIIVADHKREDYISKISEENWISASIDKINLENKSIEVLSIPWKKHSNHMWFYIEIKECSRDKINNNIPISIDDINSGEGLYFPIAPGQTTFAGLELKK